MYDSVGIKITRELSYNLHFCTSPPQRQIQYVKDGVPKFISPLGILMQVFLGRYYLRHC